MKRGLAALAALFVLFEVHLYWPQLRNEIFVIIGSRNETGGWYGLWSGFAGGVRVFEWFVILGLIWWHHQCSVSRCYWYARRTTAAGERACWKHHPTPKRTVGEVHAAHHAARRKAGHGEPGR
jgi:hypothetical protein